MGTGNLRVTGIQSTGAHADRFLISGSTAPVTLTPGDAVSFDIEFYPGAVGL